MNDVVRCCAGGMTRRLLAVLAMVFLFGMAAAQAQGHGGHGSEEAALPEGPHYPLKLPEYHDEGDPSVWHILQHRIEQEPLNLYVTIIFVCAILHTFAAGTIRGWAHHAKHEEEHYLHQHKGADTEWASRYDWLRLKASLLHLFSEVEAIFMLWTIPLLAGVAWVKGFGVMLHYIDGEVEYTEPMFVVFIMIIASCKPIVRLAEQVMSVLANLGGGTPLAWWLSILTVGPLLGSFITEPAAMTICALLLAHHLYELKPSRTLAYGTIGLLFVNVSIGGTLTNFAAPPVLMVAGRWDWSMTHMFTYFGWKAALSIVISNLIYLTFFKREFALLASQAAERKATHREDDGGNDKPIPVWITAVCVLFLGWTVLNAHSQPMVFGFGMLFFAFHDATRRYQHDLQLLPPLLVGMFLGGLVIHGGLQAWWIQPVLGSLGPTSLMLSATVLTAFNDNALITFLSTLVPGFSDAAKYAVVAGAVTGGGLTIIANAPNPAGQSVLRQYFRAGLHPGFLVLAAIGPTIIAGLCFMLL